MNALADFAGRYGAFVWPAYGFTALTYAWMIADTLGRARRWRGEAERLAGGGADTKAASVGRAARANGSRPGTGS